MIICPDSLLSSISSQKRYCPPLTYPSIHFFLHHEKFQQLAKESSIHYLLTHSFLTPFSSRFLLPHCSALPSPPLSSLPCHCRRSSGFTARSSSSPSGSTASSRCCGSFSTACTTCTGACGMTRRATAQVHATSACDADVCLLTLLRRYLSLLHQLVVTGPVMHCRQRLALQATSWACVARLISFNATGGRCFQNTQHCSSALLQRGCCFEETMKMIKENYPLSFCFPAWWINP